MTRLGPTNSPQRGNSLPAAIVVFIPNQANKERLQEAERYIEILEDRLSRGIEANENHIDGPRECEFRLTNNETSEQDEQVFRHGLLHFFEDEPIEDGMWHPAERLIEETLSVDRTRCFNWIARLFLQLYSSRPSACAALLRCVGRMDYKVVGSWGHGLARHALSHMNVEVREAAVRALEEWEGGESAQILRGHSDPEGWLANYVEMVIEDISGEE